MIYSINMNIFVSSLKVLYLRNFSSIRSNMLYEDTHNFTMKGWLIEERMLLSELTCSTCFSFTTSAFFNTFSAKYCPSVLCLTRNTRPNVPVPLIIVISYTSTFCRMRWVAHSNSKSVNTRCNESNYPEFGVALNQIEKDHSNLEHWIYRQEKKGLRGQQIPFCL